MKRLYSMMAVPLAAGLLVMAGCDETEPLPQSLFTPTRTVGGGNTPTATAPSGGTATRTSAAGTTPTATASHGVATATPTSTSGEAATPTSTSGEAATATPTPSSFAGNSYSATLPLSGGQNGALNFTVAENGTDLTGTLDTGSSAAAVIPVTGTVDAAGNFTLAGEGVALSGSLVQNTVTGTVQGTETSGTLEQSTSPTATPGGGETPTGTPGGEPTPTVTPGGAAAICGNGITEGPPTAGETCDDGNNYGGDGCAANCTTEPATDILLNFGTDQTTQSQAIVQAQSFSLPLNITGNQVTTPGTPRDDASVGADGHTNFAPGDVPVANVASKNAGRIDPIKVPGLVCACLRGIVLQTCGGLPVDPGQTDTVCNNDAFGGIDPSICPEENPCKPTFGPDVSAAGTFGCNSDSNLDYLFTADHATGAVSFVQSGAAVPFGALIHAYSAIGTIMDSGTCSDDPGNEAKGPDGIPCTDDDPATSRGTPAVQVQTTGTAQAFVLHVNGGAGNIDASSNCGATPCQTTATGSPKDCSELLQGNVQGLCLASAFAALSQPTTGDIAVPTKFCAVAP